MIKKKVIYNKIR